MAQVDIVYKQIVEEILNDGVFMESTGAKYADGTPAHTIAARSSIHVKFDGSELLYPTTKLFYGKSAMKEIEAFWFKRSNRFEDLPKKAWEPWVFTEGKWKDTIGPSYGYQMGGLMFKHRIDEIDWSGVSGSKYRNTNNKTLVNSKYAGNPNARYYSLDHTVRIDTDGKIHGPYIGDRTDYDNINYYWKAGFQEEIILLDQLDHMIQLFMKNPNTRHGVINLWNPNDIDEMPLPPCMWGFTFMIIDGKLNLDVSIRSNDVACGNPFNFFQIQVVQHVLAKFLKVKPGTISFTISNAHIYDRHVDLLKEQIKNEPKEPVTMEIEDFDNLRDFHMGMVKLHNVPKDIPVYEYELAVPMNPLVANQIQKG